MKPPSPSPSTFSIVGFDPATGDLGIAVQSKFLAVGAVVPWAQAGIGAVATQSYANTSYGPRGLAYLAQGHSAQETMAYLTGADEERTLRQVGIVSAQGDVATYTGASCHEWAGGRTGDHYCCQGNILVGEEAVSAMGETFEQVSGSLADRLLAALAAGQAAGGDRRGRQSAAILVVRENGGYGGYNDILLDLRVDDHSRPIAELQRLYDLYKLYFEKSPEADLLDLTPGLVQELQTRLGRLGYYQAPPTGHYDVVTRQALWDFSGTENLEERWREDERIDPGVLAFLRRIDQDG